MKLDEEQTRAAYYCVAEVIRGRALRGQPIPPWLRAIDSEMRAEVVKPSSPTRQDSGGQETESDHDVWIGSAEAATLLGWTVRQVQRLATDLDGRLVGGRYIYPKHAVIAYAEATHNG